MDKIMQALDSEMPGWAIRMASQQTLEQITAGLMTGRSPEWAEHTAKYNMRTFLHHVINAALASGEVVLPGSVG